jgi:chromosome segregation protein
MLEQMRQKESTAHGVKVVGQLAQFLTIPDEYQTAVTAALGFRLATLIAPDTAVLWQLVEKAEGGVTAVALDQIQPSPQPELPSQKGVIGWANKLVKCEKKAQSAADLLLGAILLVESAPAAYAVAAELPGGMTAVSRDGFVAHAGGLVQTDGRSAQNNILAQEQEWRAAQEEAKRLQASLAEEEQRVQAQQTAVQKQQDEVDNLQTEEQRLSRLMNEASQDVAIAQRNLDRSQQQQNYLQRQQANQAKELEQLQTRITEMTQVIAQHQTSLRQAETNWTDARAKLASLPVAESAQQRSTLQQAIVAAQTIVSGRQAVVDSRRATLNQLDNQVRRLEFRRDGLLKQQGELVQSQQASGQRPLADQLQRLEADLKPIVSRLAEVRGELRDVEEVTAVTQRQLHDLENRHTQSQIRLSQQEGQLESLQDRIKADLGLVALHYDEDQTGPTPLPIGEVVDQLPEVVELPTDIESTIHNYRGQLQRMGAINPDAPVEFEETQNRYDFLEQQVEDLNQTDAQLREIIAELDDLTSRAFKETVEKVNVVFGTTFTQLFGGGSAQLVLTDPDNLTISGVDILARLPNRREQSLGLLSGGERSLTAVALIFSLLKVSPTPFCVMDEVDAALDEANINRFRDLLRELSLNTQFIVITHNRGTVQAAQTIYGISMGSDSASQAISIKPEDYVKQAELL